MPNKLHLLQEVEIFQDLSRGEIQEIERQTVMIPYKEGNLFYMPDDPGEVLFILKRGRVQLYRMTTDGRKLVVETLGPGAIFGQMALVGQRLYNTFAEAITDALICTMNRDEVERLLVEKPPVALRFLDAMGRRLFEVEERLEETAFKRVPARIASLLLRLNRDSNGTGIIKGYTHQYLADIVGTYRETTTQTLNDFKSRNLIRTGRKTIEILDLEGLQHIAEMG